MTTPANIEPATVAGRWRSARRRDITAAVVASSSEAFLRAFHAGRPGVTSIAFERGGSYDRLADRVPPRGRVLELACGDGPLLQRLGPRAFGADVSHAELVRARARGLGHVIQARAQALPFRDRSFCAATCHLAFMLFDDLDEVIAELARVLEPGAPLLAVVGGGPTADGRDAFHALCELLPQGPALGDRRACSEAGWRALFVPTSWTGVHFERWAIDLSGSFEEVWHMLGASYPLADLAAPEQHAVRERVRAQFPGAHVPCTVALHLATVTRQSEMSGGGTIARMSRDTARPL
jgi:SAM-dependent methyltransferase